VVGRGREMPIPSCIALPEKAGVCGLGGGGVWVGPYFSILGWGFVWRRRIERHRPHLPSSTWEWCVDIVGCGEGFCVGLFWLCWGGVLAILLCVLKRVIEKTPPLMMGENSSSHVGGDGGGVSLGQGWFVGGGGWVWAFLLVGAVCCRVFVTILNSH